MNKPEPMTDAEMLHELTALDADTKRLPPGFRAYAKGIAYLRDAQWEQMLAGQERAFADAARRSGLTLLKTQKGYELQDLGLITAHAAPQTAQEEKK